MCERPIFCAQKNYSKGTMQSVMTVQKYHYDTEVACKAKSTVGAHGDYNPCYRTKLLRRVPAACQA